MNEKQISELIREYSRSSLPRLMKLGRYYRGEHEILRARKEQGKPDNRLVNNFCRAITDSTVGYFMGIPVTYAADGAAADVLPRLSAANDEAFCNSRLASELSIYGRAAELLWCRENGDVRFSPIDPLGVIPVYDGTLDESLSAAIRFFEADGSKVEVYYSDHTDYFDRRDSGVLIKTGEREHYFGEVPINLYKNNRDEIGDFESVLTLVDAYNKMQSDSLNDFELFADSFLAISGMGGATREDIEQIRNDRVILLDDGGKAEWLTKQVNDEYIENMKKRLSSDIFRFSATPDMSEDSLFNSGTSGVAIKFRLLAFDNRVKVTEQYFRRSLLRRWKLIFNCLGVYGSTATAVGIRPCFSRNLPGIIESSASAAEKLSGIISDETLFSLMPFIEDPRDEIERKRGEAKLSSAE